MDEEAAYDVTADSTGRPTTPMGTGPKFHVLLILLIEVLWVCL